MDASKRIVVNTLAQHIRSVLNIGLSLYSTRIILQALGQMDFGVYSLVAGVVAMLGFLTNAMVVTTQRHYCDKDERRAFRDMLEQWREKRNANGGHIQRGVTFRGNTR